MFDKFPKTPKVTLLLTVLCLLPAGSVLAQEKDTAVKADTPVFSWVSKDSVNVKTNVVLKPDESEPSNVFFEYRDNKLPVVFLGIEGLNLTPELMDHFGLEGQGGVMISKVTPESPADNAGLKVGDIVVGAEDQNMTRVGQMISFLSGKKAGDLVNYAVWRDGHKNQIEVELADAPFFEREPLREVLGDYSFGPEDQHNVFQFLEETGADFPLRVKVVEIPDQDLSAKIKMLEDRLKKLETLLEKKTRDK